MTSRLDREREYHNSAYQSQSRAGLGKYYAIARNSHFFYHQQLINQAAGKQVLEYGCGLGSYAYDLARQGARVTGIDLSEVAIDTARETATQAQLSIDFQTMNAEELQFPANSFDRICGNAILHHLQLERALGEIVRTLKPEGSAIFLEPLGHNPFINVYRRLTPHIRTPDEHPLLEADLQLLNQFFQHVELQFFHLSTFLAVPFGRFSFFPALLSMFERSDNWLFRSLPLSRSYAWIVVMVLSKPLKDQKNQSF